MDREKLIEWIYENEEMVNVPDDEYFAVKSVHLVYAINNGAFDKESCEMCTETDGFMPLDMIYCSSSRIDGEDYSIKPFNHCPNCGRSLSTNK